MIPNGKKIRIAFLANDIAAGGAAKSLLLHLKSLDHNFVVAYLYVTKCSNDEMKRDFQKYCTLVKIVKLKEIHGFKRTKMTSYLEYIFSKYFRRNLVKTFIKKLLKNQIDILHINTTVFPLVHRWVKKHSNIKIVTHLREVIQLGSLNYVQKFMIDQIFNYSDCLISISNNEMIPFMKHHNLNILPNPYDFSQDNDHKNVFNHNHRNKRDEIVQVGMFGNFASTKGHLFFLKALKEIIESNETKFKFLFLIIGASPSTPSWKIIIKKILFRRDYASEVYNYIKKNNLEAYLKLITNTYRIRDIQKSVDIVVRPNAFPWGRDIIESMALGKPIVAFGSSEFYIENNCNGFLVPSNSPRELAHKIVDLINNPNKRQKFGANGYKKVREMCDISKYGISIMKIYKSLGSK